MKEIVIVGSKGHAKVIADIVEREGRYKIRGLLDDLDPNGPGFGQYRVLGATQDLPKLGQNLGVIVGIGENWTRSKIVERIKQISPQSSFVNALHPNATVSTDVKLGIGTVVMAGAVINPGCEVADHVIVNTGCILDHDTKVGAFASMGPRSVTGGNAEIGNFAVIAIGATISHRVHIGEHTILGAGSVAVKNLKPMIVAYGIPAREVRARKPGDKYL